MYRELSTVQITYGDFFGAGDTHDSVWLFILLDLDSFRSLVLVSYVRTYVFYVSTIKHSFLFAVTFFYGILFIFLGFSPFHSLFSFFPMFILIGNSLKPRLPSFFELTSDWKPTKEQFLRAHYTHRSYIGSTWVNFDAYKAIVDD